MQLALRGGILAGVWPIIPPGGGTQMSRHDVLSHVPRGSVKGGHWQSPMQLGGGGSVGGVVVVVGGSGVGGVVEGGGVVVVVIPGAIVVPLQSSVFISLLISSIVRVSSSLLCQVD